MLHCMWFSIISLSWELDLLLFRHQECLIFVLHFSNEAERAACCQFNYQIYLKPDSMIALTIKQKKKKKKTMFLLRSERGFLQDIYLLTG